MEGLVERVAGDPDTVTLVPAAWPVPDGSRFVTVAVHPVPLFPMYAVWKRAAPTHSCPPCSAPSALAATGPAPSMTTTGYQPQRGGTRRATKHSSREEPPGEVVPH